MTNYLSFTTFCRPIFWLVCLRIAAPFQHQHQPHPHAHIPKSSSKCYRDRERKGSCEKTSLGLSITAPRRLPILELDVLISRDQYESQEALEYSGLVQKASSNLSQLILIFMKKLSSFRTKTKIYLIRIDYMQFPKRMRRGLAVRVTSITRSLPSKLEF